MTTILCIDTAEKICSVALSRDGHCVDELKEEIPNSHSTALTILIGKLLEQNNLNFTDLDAVCVSAGPGSYTGLRIGVSTAKGICWSTDKPLIAVNTLECIKEHGLEKHPNYDIIIPNIDARRNEVFLSVFEKNKETVAPKPYVLDENPLSDYNNQTCLIVGSGSNKFETFIKETDQIDTSIVPTAKHLCSAAYSKYNKEAFEDVAYFEPLYFKAVHVMKSKKKIF